jgi:hypothetical protein
VRQDQGLQKVQAVQIDYDDIHSIRQALERHNIHTIISAIGLVSDETSQSQLNLIEAADRSSATKRFIPSEYSFVQTVEYASISICVCHLLMYLIIKVCFPLILVFSGGLMRRFVSRPVAWNIPG